MALVTLYYYLPLSCMCIAAKPHQEIQKSKCLQVRKRVTRHQMASTLHSGSLRPTLGDMSYCCLSRTLEGVLKISPGTVSCSTSALGRAMLQLAPSPVSLCNTQLRSKESKHRQQAQCFLMLPFQKDRSFTPEAEMLCFPVTVSQSSVWGRPLRHHSAMFIITT